MTDPPEQQQQQQQQRKICSRCSKPNAISVSFCTACGEDLLDSKLVQVPNGCKFCDIITGAPQGSGGREEEVILFQDERLCIFEAKFPVATIQINISPINHIESVLQLTPDDAEDWLVYALRTGIEQLYLQHKARRRQLSKVEDDEGEEMISIDKFQQELFFGFNYPPSVPHLHLVIFGLPLMSKEPPLSFFSWPRWIPYEEVVESLRSKGRVLVESERVVDPLLFSNHQLAKQHILNLNRLLWEKKEEVMNGR